MNSPTPGTPQTAHKAWSSGAAGAITTLVMFYLARLTEIVPAPEMTEVQHASVFLISTAIGFVTGRVAYLIPNKPL